MLEMEESYAQKERAMMAKMWASEESRTDSLQEMRAMLAKWQRHSAHAKDDYEQMSAKLESRIHDLNDELARTRLKADQALKMHFECKNSLAEVSLSF